jgi:hypothetical protein
MILFPALMMSLCCVMILNGRIIHPRPWREYCLCNSFPKTCDFYDKYEKGLLL